MKSKYPSPEESPPDSCLTHSGLLPDEDTLTTFNADPHFLLGSYEGDCEHILDNVFLQRLTVPMQVYSERARRDIELPDLASIHRWAATEFDQYQMSQL